jgi:hypothetical protein
MNIFAIIWLINIYTISEYAATLLCMDFRRPRTPSISTSPYIIYFLLLSISSKYRHHHHYHCYLIIILEYDVTLLCTASRRLRMPSISTSMQIIAFCYPYSVLSFTASSKQRNHHHCY